MTLGGWDAASAVPLLLELVDGSGSTYVVGRVGWTAPTLPRVGESIDIDGHRGATVTGIRWELATAGGVLQLQRAVIEGDLGPYSGPWTGATS